MSRKRLPEELVQKGPQDYSLMERVGSTEQDQQRLYDALERRASEKALIESQNRVKRSRLVTIIAMANMAVAVANIVFWQSAILSVSVFAMSVAVIAISMMSNKKIREYDRVRSLEDIDTMLVHTDVADTIHDSYDNETADSSLLREELRDVCSLYSRSTEKPGPETIKAIERLISEKQMALENNTAAERNRKKLELEERDAGQAKAIAEVYGEGVETRNDSAPPINDFSDMARLDQRSGEEDKKPSLSADDDDASEYAIDSLFDIEFRARRNLDETKRRRGRE